MKRWGFKGQPASHGQTKTHRRPGAISTNVRILISPYFVFKLSSVFLELLSKNEQFHNTCYHVLCASRESQLFQRKFRNLYNEKCR